MIAVTKAPIPTPTNGFSTVLLKSFLKPLFANFFILSDRSLKPINRLAQLQQDLGRVRQTDVLLALRARGICGGNSLDAPRGQRGQDPRRRWRRGGNRPPARTDQGQAQGYRRSSHSDPPRPGQGALQTQPQERRRRRRVRHPKKYFSIFLTFL